MNRYLKFFLYVLLSLFFIDANSKDNKYGGTIVLYTSSDPKSFNPIVAKETSTTTITSLIFEGLTTINPLTLEVEPNLASNWEVDSSGTEWIFHLRKDIKWSDGVEFKSDDVVFTFNELIYNKDVMTSYADIFTIEGKKIKVEKIDDYTVKFTLPFKFAPFLKTLTCEILPKHKLENVVKDLKFNSYWGQDTKLEDIVGTGPFKLEKYLPSERIELTRNKYYWKKSKEQEQLPYLDRVIFLIIKNPDLALLKFQAKEIDYLALRGEDFSVLKPKEKELNFKIYNTGPSLGINFLVFNQNSDINPSTRKTYIDERKLRLFKNLNFRKAIAHSIDRKSIIDIVMNGFGTVCDSPLTTSSGFFYNPDVKKYEYDLEKARNLLKDIGIYDRNKDKKLDYSDGTQVEFNLFTNSENTERVKIANIIRKDLETLGFKVNFIPLAFNQLVSKLDSTYDWDCVLIGLTGSIDPHFGSNVWKSSGHLHVWHPRQREPDTDWEKEIDKIFDEAVKILDEKERKILYDRFQEIVAENLPVIFTVVSYNLFAVRDKFGNLKPTSYGGAFHNIEEIYIKD